jgi:hypothetical protein
MNGAHGAMLLFRHQSLAVRTGGGQTLDPTARRIPQRSGLAASGAEENEPDNAQNQNGEPGRNRQQGEH